MTKVTIIINEQHSLLPEQKEILEKEFKTWETLLVPEKGWNKEQLENTCGKLSGTIVFCSVIGPLIKWLSEDALANNVNKNPEWGYPITGVQSDVEKVLVFFNANREKKELPNGKVISAIAKTGWELL